ncbi:MAG: hypothetical protein B7Y39_10375 [Bdellovibrio sp. 28-41-41]|nr:MAG: hypothetical protein B7Y39_10375 [Bdellovibrio sp. 28-41-41]
MNILTQLLAVFIFMTSILSSAEPETFFYGDPIEDFRAQKIDVGYFIQRNLLDDSFFVYNITQRIFSPLKTQSPYVITAPMIARFSPIIKSLESYIDEQKKGIMSQCEGSSQKCSKTFESINGITERELAAEITKASYCFGTDPFVVTSKIRQESRFDMSSVSNTGAIGLTQMTALGLKEALDQMGHRGAKYAFMDNKEFLDSAVKCYVQTTDVETFKGFPEIKTTPVKNGGLEYTGETIKNLKAWVLPRKNQSQASVKERKKIIQRQLFLGQILLKIYLAYSKKALKNQTITRQYEAALRMFNGDDIRVKYAKEVIKFSRQAQSL